jgi:hypothetical protein
VKDAFLLAFGAVLVAATACEQCSGQSTAPRAAPPSASSAPVSDCARACAILADAGCSSRPRCEQACDTDQSLGVASVLDLGCVLDAGPNPSALRRCNVGGACP